MPHRNAIRQRVDSILEEWETLKAELERVMRVMRLESEHLHKTNEFQERLLQVSASVDFSHDGLKYCTDQVEELRMKIKRKLFHEKTVTGIKLDHPAL